MRHILGLLGLVMASAVAQAGPIQFHYAMTRTQEAGTPSPGAVALNLLSGGDVQINEFGGSFTIGWVTLGDSPGPFATGQTESYSAFSSFSFTANIQDSSGLTGSVTMYGGALDSWDYRDWDGRWMNSVHRLDLGDPASGNIFTSTTLIGENLYYLRAIVRDEGTRAEILFGVVPDPDGAPEPATLALAAIALLPVGARAARRKWRGA